MFAVLNCILLYTNYICIIYKIYMFLCRYINSRSEASIILLISAFLFLYISLLPLLSRFSAILEENIIKFIWEISVYSAKLEIYINYTLRSNFMVSYNLIVSI